MANRGELDHRTLPSFLINPLHLILLVPGLPLMPFHIHPATNYEQHRKPDWDRDAGGAMEEWAILNNYRTTE